MPYCKPENVQNNNPNGSIEKIQSKSIPPYQQKKMKTNDNYLQLIITA